MARATRWVRGLLLVATALLLVLFARSVHWHETWAAMRRVTPTLLLLAAVANLYSLGARGLRWWVFLLGAGVRSPWLAVRGAIVGSGLNNLVPASAGEPARAVLVAWRAHQSRARVMATVALDRFVDVASYLLLLVAVSVVVPLPGPLEAWGRRAGWVLAGLLLIATLLAWQARSAPSTRFGRTQLARPWSALARFAGTLRELPTAGRLIAALALSMASWAGQLATYHFTARAAGVDVGIVPSLAAMLAVNLAFVIQLTPGNVGIFQVIYALAMTPFGVPRGTAVGVALLIQALQIIPVTLLALVLAPDMALRRRRLDSPPIRPDEGATRLTTRDRPSNR